MEEVKSEMSVLVTELELAEKAVEEVTAVMSVLAIELKLAENTEQDWTADTSLLESDSERKIVRATRRYT